MVAPIQNKKKKKTLLTVNLPHLGTPYLYWTSTIAEHPSHSRPAPPQYTLLTLDLPHHGTPYSLWTSTIAEHPSHRGPATPKTPYSLWTCLTAERPTHCGSAKPQKTLFIKCLPHCRTPYLPWTCPIWNTLLTQRKKTSEKNGE